MGNLFQKLRNYLRSGLAIVLAIIFVILLVFSYFNLSIEDEQLKNLSHNLIFSFLGTLLAFLGVAVFAAIYGKDELIIALPMQPQIEEAQEWMVTGKIAEIKWDNFNESFEEQLERSTESIHIAILNYDSFPHYLDEDLSKVWKDNSEPLRRRLVVWPGDRRELLDNGNVDNTRAIFKFLSDTAANRCVRIEKLVDRNLQNLIKDCAVFSNSNGEKKGFLSFAPRGDELRFAKASSKKFKIVDHKILAVLNSDFDRFWNDPECEKETDEFLSFINRKGEVCPRSFKESPSS